MGKPVWTHDNLLSMLYVIGWQPIEPARIVTEGKVDGRFMIHRTFAGMGGSRLSKPYGGMELAHRTVTDKRPGKESVAEQEQYCLTGWGRYVGLYSTFPVTGKGRRKLYDKVCKEMGKC